MLFRVFILAGALGAVGCAASPDPAEGPADTTAASERVCFNIRQVRGFSSVDDRHVVIDAGGSSGHYLVTTFTSCPGLDWANAIALSNFSSRVCSNDFGSVTFRDRGMNRVERCRISDIEPVEDAAAGRALVEEPRTSQRDDG